MRYPLWIAVLAALALAVTGCGDDESSGEGGGGGGGGGGNGAATGEGPCDDASDCANDVCVALIDGNNPPVYCSEPCSADSCPDGFVCDESTFGLIGLSFCRFGEAGTEPSPPAEPPRVPCTDDADCEGDLVCAEYNGERDCTVACAAEDDCTPPTMGGITFDLATCAPDQRTDVTRDVCLPDEACYPNVQGCISGMDIPGGGGEFPDIPGT